MFFTTNIACDRIKSRSIKKQFSERMIFVAKKGGNIVIIGGGASGMTAAIRAKQRGAEQVILLEASSELGGMRYTHRSRC